MKIKYPSRNIVLSLYSAIIALYSDYHLLSQNSACRNIEREPVKCYLVLSRAVHV